MGFEHTWKMGVSVAAAWLLVGAASSADAQTRLPRSGPRPAPTVAPRTLSVPSGVIVGVVKDAQDRPVPNVAIVVWDEDGATDQRMATSRANQYGEFKVSYPLRPVSGGTWDPPTKRMGTNPDIYVAATVGEKQVKSRVYPEASGNLHEVLVAEDPIPGYLAAVNTMIAKGKAIDAAMAKFFAGPSSGPDFDQNLQSVRTKLADMRTYFEAHRYPGADVGTQGMEKLMLHAALVALQDTYLKLTDQNAPANMRSFHSVAGGYFEALKLDIVGCAGGSSAYKGCDCWEAFMACSAPPTMAGGNLAWGVGGADPAKMCLTTCYPF